jgi:hypothetical protein
MECPSANHDWEEWIAEQLLAGQDRSTIENVLIFAGFNKQNCESLVSRVAGAPGMRSALRLSGEKRKFESVLAIYCDLWRIWPGSEDSTFY